MKWKVLLLLVLLVGSVFLCSPALAIPSLQLDIDDGAHYDWSTESIVTASGTFELLAFLIPDNKALISAKYYISAAVVPKSPLSSSFGSFEINGVTYPDNSNMLYGTPPSFGTEDLGHKGEYFPTAYAEIAFYFDSTVSQDAYDTQEKYTVTPAPPPKDEDMYYVAFAVDVSGLAAGYEIHFDLYGVGSNGKLVTAPYSHDAETVPEPATMLLLGAGLIGLAAFGRRRLFQK